MKVLVFHVKFIDLIARPPGKSLSDIAREYDSRLGMPSTQQRQDLLRLTAEAGAISSWAFVLLSVQLLLLTLLRSTVFEEIRLPLPSDAKLSQMLRKAVQNSKKKKYHFNTPCNRFQNGKCKFLKGCKYNHVLKATSKE